MNIVCTLIVIHICTLFTACDHQTKIADRTPANIAASDMALYGLFTPQQLPDKAMINDVAGECVVGLFRFIWPAWWGEQVELVQNAVNALGQVIRRFSLPIP